MLDVMLIQPNPGTIFVKISEDVIIHDFTITEGNVEYIVRKNCGEPVARSTAEVTSTKEVDGHLRGMTIRTDIYDFEIVQNECYTFYAYRSLRCLSQYMIT